MRAKYYPTYSRYIAEHRESERSCRRHQQDVANLPPACIHYQIRAGEERKRHDVIGEQIFSASHMVAMNDVFAMRAETAAESDVGGESSPQTDKKEQQKEVRDPRDYPSASAR